METIYTFEDLGYTPEVGEYWYINDRLHVVSKVNATEGIFCVIDCHFEENLENIEDTS
jgi:hypothetical protein